ncbi:bifunctional ADP-dependent NAD(P)H-hydrate dehydratase/NAD(P)H-hydrate epimerase [candidate division KSB1 bacterium]|nr:MAG: bifunctional ADP-dependent NAD(P)H-hydrate dehydratase/NAD(P)H-hydrate epimerase [candidate division KSB1 bacterium]
MKRVLTVKQMRNIDSYTINELGIPGMVLMERAALAVVDEIRDYLGSLKNKRILIFCGSGNNGGDGFAAARELIIKEADVKIYVCTEKEKIKGDALINLQILEKEGFNPVFINGVDEISPMDFKCDVIVDALLGTGIKGPVRGLYKKVIDLINETGIPVISVDIPSGLNCNTGRFEGACIKAERTVTMGALKRAHLISPGRELSGKVKIADIGFSENSFNRENIKLNLIEKDDVKNLLPQREKTFHKGDCGKLFILSGSIGMTGAATLLSLSAMRIGAGLAVLGIPRSLNPILEEKLTEVMTLPLPETPYGSLSLKGKNQILEMLDWANAVAIGPGISRKEETLQLIVEIVKNIKKPLILDADGIYPFYENLDILKKLEPEIIITPHHGELAHLIGKPINEIEKDRIKTAVEIARELDLVLLLKGSPTLISTETGECFISNTGNPGMATGGSGDVLTGMIAGLVTQGLSVRDAGICGAYLHGLAGDLAEKEFGEMGLIAGDIMNKIPLSLKLTLN